MYKLIAQIIKMIAEILGTAFLRAAADEFTKKAYGSSYPRRRPFNVDREISRTRSEREATSYHDVLMMAFDITGPNAAIVHEWLFQHMPDVGEQEITLEGETFTVNLDSTWIADDDAPGDLDSAVFVRKGDQAEARRLLRMHGLID